MAFGPYQHTPAAYQGTGETAYQIAVVGGGSLVCASADVTGTGTITGGGVGPVQGPQHIHLDPLPIYHKKG